MGSCLLRTERAGRCKVGCRRAAVCGGRRGLGDIREVAGGQLVCLEGDGLEM